MVYFPYDVLLILGHMRSRSTLITNILQTAGCTSGVDEYQFPFDNVYKLHLLLNNVTKHYSFDKNKLKFIVNVMHHNKLFIADEVLNHDKVKILILYRSPQSFFSSMDRFTKRNNIIQYKDIDTRYWYYVTRLQWLESYWRMTPKDKTLTMETDEFAKNPKLYLYKLQKFLNLKKPLPTTYKHFKRKLGDNMPLIETNTEIIYKDRPMEDFHPDPVKREIAIRLYNRLHGLFTNSIKINTISYKTYLQEYSNYIPESY